jgi:hypothetical protein
MKAEEEAALQRILGAIAKEDKMLVGNLSCRDTPQTARDLLWQQLNYACTGWLPIVLDNRRWYKERTRQIQRIVEAARILQANLGSPADIEWAKRIEQRYTPVPADPDEFAEFTGTGSVLMRLVGRLAVTFEWHFHTSAGYTTNPDSGETDGPFIRFVEQVFREFGITRDGNQPYQRRSIADALTKSRNQTKASG